MLFYHKTEEKRMSIVMTGGGTGGHLAIVRAVKEQLSVSGEKSVPGSGFQVPKDTSSHPASTIHHPPLIYIGSTKGQDRQWFEEDDDFSSLPRCTWECIPTSKHQVVYGFPRTTWEPGNSASPLPAPQNADATKRRCSSPSDTSCT